MKSILVIDDDVDIREVLVFALESEGFTVSSAENGRIGLDALLNASPAEHPGLIIVDYLMPEMDGIEFIKTIKAEHAESLGRIPIIISSAMGTAVSDEVEHLEGVIKLFKPMDLDDLLKIAHEHC